MEEWEMDYFWLQLRHRVKESFDRENLPDLNAVLFLIGIQELGRWKKHFSKEEKQDLMHIAVCRLLSYEGYYTFTGRDEDGWPHWQSVRKITPHNLKEQERLLKINAIRYFRDLDADQQFLSDEEE